MYPDHGGATASGPQAQVVLPWFTSVSLHFSEPLASICAAGRGVWELEGWVGVGRSGCVAVQLVNAAAGLQDSSCTFLSWFSEDMKENS